MNGRYIKQHERQQKPRQFLISIQIPLTLGGAENILHNSILFSSQCPREIKSGGGRKKRTQCQRERRVATQKALGKGSGCHHSCVIQPLWTGPEEAEEGSGICI